MPDDIKLPEPAFQLWWDGYRYKVSKPYIGDTDVYTADQLRAAVLADRASRWQPIETAPRDGIFLGWIRAERWSAIDGGGSGQPHDVSQVDFCWWRPVQGSPNGGYWDNSSGQVGDGQEVTHWQPLPAPPTQDGRTDGGAA